mmetsp:Transcript_10911/g.13133  ORF Transcript_10911/g.13133 Transcript_10911/m.13133 type:complete len:182 (+) Transcript_10911:175-720(+)|eukprot:CAMPEP_0195315010 /NCGR_PEP_ID=MMETSP0708-20121125/2745_1 /TAXON_ID=33640 /ORGANISM="Asterionellopsis glacialis, Strain CCMP134" /LENGTH=181 /DNA_ID=CAMNT_0040380131 /DNA_START=88 /DNA_END=630 /DNA_ORIENTATION=+
MITSVLTNRMNAAIVRMGYRHVGWKLQRRLLTTGEKTSFREKLSVWRNNGTIEISFGMLIFGLIGIDQLLQYQQQTARDTIVKNIQHQLDRDYTQKRSEMWSTELLTQKPLFGCVVKQIPQLFDGSKSLTNVQIGEAVDVLEEGVGPDGMYNLCRTCPQDKKSSMNASIGWFPMSCLEKIE